MQLSMIISYLVVSGDTNTKTDEEIHKYLKRFKELRLILKKHLKCKELSKTLMPSNEGKKTAMKLMKTNEKLTVNYFLVILVCQWMSLGVFLKACCPFKLMWSTDLTPEATPTSLLTVFWLGLGQCSRQKRIRCWILNYTPRAQWKPLCLLPVTTVHIELLSKDETFLPVKLKNISLNNSAMDAGIRLS